MKRYFAAARVAIFLAALVLPPKQSAVRKHSQYVSADIATASDIQYPVNTMSVGAVSLLLNLDTSARIQNVQVLRDFPSLTSTVQAAVQGWTFKPATLNGHAVSSSISVTVIFNIFNPGGGAASRALALAPAQSIPPDALEFAPPQIVAASFANYPANSVAQGSVVLDVTVSEESQPKTIRVLRGIQTLASQAVSAVKAWGFNAGTLHGKPITSQIVIAFVFQRNMS